AVMGQPQIDIDEKEITAGQEKLYDASPYESYSYYKTHPDYLYLLGRLHGLNPPDYRKARVLELGCAGGGNRAPFAYLYPEAACVGIDVSGEEIKQANQ